MEEILNRITQLKRRLIPDERLILIGSQARGDARPDSDWDLLVLVDKKKQNFNEDYEKYASPFDELGWKYGTLINAIVYVVKYWYSHPSLLRYNVEREEIEIK
jgi:predicted nucleotidyltransferase